jgi:peptidoglycan/xylan/chitin deacetylase (PgdA/CDA1 family)
MSARRIALAAALLLVCLCFPGRALAAGQTVVSLTFDDGTATQYQAGAAMATHGMRGTFYVNSSRLGSSDYYMTWAQVQLLAAIGNEIGGHTAHHVNLPQTDPTEARRQICLDRVNLLNNGLDATDFAYPYGAFNATTEQQAQACGYNSARSTNVHVPEDIPPADPYAIHEGGGGGDLQSLKNAVTTAEQQGGGWVPLVFHQICDGCDTGTITPADFNAFLDWLQLRGANGTVVKTVAQVTGGSVKPAVAPPAPPPAPNGSNAVRNASLETDTNTDSAPDCWTFDNFGNNSFNWMRTSDAHSGSWAERVNITNYQDGDAKLEPTQDLGFCTPTVTPGHRYVITAWYKSDAPVSFSAFSRDTLGGFGFWTSSSTFPASSTWQKASWTTPVIPSGTNGLSFGLTLSSNGSLTVDDLGMDDASPTGGADTTPPTVSITAPSANATVAGSVPLSVAAADNKQVDHVDYLVDGTTVTTSASAPFDASWNARAVANGTHTLTARAVDLAGNATTSGPVQVLVANQQTNLLQNPSLETAAGSTPSCWTLGGYGVNSFAWTRTSDAHTGGFAEKLDVSSLTSGDRKLINTQDTGACAVAATPGHSYSVSAWYKSPLDTNPAGTQPILFAYYRSSAGVWTYWSQSPRLPTSATWRQGTWTTPALPAGATAISVGPGLQSTGTVTMDDVSLSDNAPPPDTTAPTSTITCNQADDGGGCVTPYYNDTVQVALSATDDQFGSGVASIRYTTDGSFPTLTNGSTYSGAFSIVSPGATLRWRAFDKAGNAEAVHNQVIRIDPDDPSSSISCNGAACKSDFYGDSVSVTLDGADTGGSGLREIRYTTDGSDPSANNGTQYLGAFSLAQTTTIKYRAYDNAGNPGPVQTQTIQIDTVAPSTAISCDGAPCRTQAYPDAVQVGLDATDDLAGSGVAFVRYTTDGSDPTATNGTVYLAPFTFSVDRTTTVKYRAFDNAGNAEPVNTQIINVNAAPAVTLTSPGDGSTVSGTTPLQATAGDPAVTSVDFQVDGHSVGTDGTAPYSVDWDSTSVPDGSHTITARGLGSGGSLVGSATARVTVDNSSEPTDTTPPTSTIKCDGDACVSTYYQGAVSVALSADDGADGSGVREIRYTTDGSDPTDTNGTVYSGTFSVPGTTTVKYRAYDNAGNAEAVQTQAIHVDRTAPVSSISCGSGACASSFYNAAVSVSLAAGDTGGSGVDRIVYTTDGSDPTTTNGTDFTNPFVVSATTTVKYRAFDAAGNAEPINSARIKVDTAPPSTTISCAGGSCAGAFKPGTQVALTATDPDSGVAAIRYTRDGSTPTATQGTLYVGPFTVNAATTVKYRAVDNVGNLEPVNTTTVQIDTTAPTVSVTSPKTGDVLSGSATLTADANDNEAVDHVDFLVDGQQVGTDSSAPYSFTWDTRTAKNGTRAITARAVDTAGNATTSGATTVTVTNNNLLANPSLETASGSTPTCWTLGGYGTNTFTWTRTSDAHTGGFGEKLDISSLSTGDRKMVSVQDAGACAPPAAPGETYTVTAWYKSTNGPQIFAYYRNSAGSWVYWAQSKSLPSVTAWTQAAWTTPTLPAGATAISVGPGLLNPGSLTMDDLGLFRNG